MALTSIQSIMTQLSLVEDAFIKGDRLIDEAKLEANFRSVRRDLLLAGLKELAGPVELHIEHRPVERFMPVTWIISTAHPDGPAEPRPTFGPRMAEKLNACTKDYCRGAEDHLIQEVKPSDYECIRSERMIHSLLANVALDLSNRAPDAVLDPITPAEMAAFAFPGGLLSGQPSGAPDAVQPM